MKNLLLSIAMLTLFFACNKKHTVKLPESTPNQTKIVSWYKDISRVSNVCPDSLVFYAENIERLAKKESSEYRAMAEIVKGVYYQSNSSHELSRRAFEKAISLITDPKKDTICAKAYIGMGNYFKNTGDYPNGLSYLLKALKIYERTNDKNGISSARGGMAQIYLQKNDLESAKENLKIALNVLGNDTGNQFYLISAHTLANVYGMSGDFKRALEIDKKGIAISEQIKSQRNKAMFLDNKANCFMYSNQLDSAEYYFNECLKIDYAVGEKKQIADSYANLGNLAIFQKRYLKAEEYLLKSIALCKELNQKPNLITAHEMLVNLYKVERKFEKALATEFEKEKIYQEVISAKKEAALAEYKVVHETQKKEQLLAESKLLLLQNEEKTRRKNYMLAAFLLLSIFTALIGYFLYRQQKVKVIQQQKEFELKSAIAQIEKQNELQEQRLRISRDLHDNIGAQLTFIISSVDNIKYAFEIQNEKLSSKLQTISNFAKSTIIELRDTIWAMNSDKISLEDLKARTLNFIEKAKAAKEEIDFSFTIDDQLLNLYLNSVFGMNLYRVLQEAINNAIKYANAKEIKIDISMLEDKVAVMIKDDGEGFDVEKVEKGNGLINMEKRIESIGGILSIYSTLNHGTTVLILLTKMPFQND